MKKIISIFILSLLSTITLAGGPFPMLPPPDFFDESPIEMSKSDYIKESYSKRDSYDLKFRMASSVEKYLNISEDLEELEKNAKIKEEKIKKQAELEKKKKINRKNYFS